MKMSYRLVAMNYAGESAGQQLATAVFQALSAEGLPVHNITANLVTDAAAVTGLTLGASYDFTIEPTPPVVAATQTTAPASN